MQPPAMTIAALQEQDWSVLDAQDDQEPLLTAAHSKISSSMAAWGAPGSGAGVDEWVQQLQDNDAKLTSINIFRTRKFGPEVGCL